MNEKEKLVWDIKQWGYIHMPDPEILNEAQIAGG